ncbi:MAG: MarR family transcriptional regulator [Planctomycetota bacterium]|nr:MAG: MarR family transcriptional regulator [Planctomycetota bacterium]
MAEIRSSPDSREPAQSPSLAELSQEISASCLGLRLRLLARMVTRGYDDALRPFGIRITQLSLLVAIHRKEPVPAYRLGEVLSLEKSTLSRNLDRLRERGWLAEAMESGGRGDGLRLSAEGRRMIQRAGPAWRQAQAQVEARFGKEGTRQLVQIAAASGGLPGD